MVGRRLSVPGQFLQTVERYDLIPAGSVVLVALSGGADSVGLLHLVRAAAPRKEWSVRAFHLNHRLRNAAVEEEEFVRQLCQKWGVPLEVEQADVVDEARRRHLSLEEAAREVRYRLVEIVRQHLNCNCVALGHTADDNLETVIMNLVRGTGMRGLAGIPVRRGVFVRPLLDIERQRLREYLRGRGISWKEDESNLDQRFRRNMIRTQLIPLLRRLNPTVAQVVRRASELMRAEDEFLDSQATGILEQICRQTEERVVFDTHRLRNYNSVLVRRMLRQLVPGLDAGATERILELLAKHRGRLSLVAGMEVRKRDRVVEFVWKRKRV